MELTKEVIDRRNRVRYLEDKAYYIKWLKENDTYDKWFRMKVLMAKRVREYDEGVNRIIEEENKKEDLRWEDQRR
ncbi:hypothetical protein ES705_24177 [subsurface metagenome]